MHHSLQVLFQWVRGGESNYFPVALFVSKSVSITGTQLGVRICIMDGEEIQTVHEEKNTCPFGFEIKGCIAMRPAYCRCV